MREFFLKIGIGFGLGLMISHLGIAAEKLPLSNRIETLLEKNFPSAKIMILPSSELPKLEANEEVTSLQLGRIVPNGQTEIFVNTSQGRALSGVARYEARVPVLVALRRIRPGERLTKEDFQLQDVNVAQGLNYEYRGVMVSADTMISQYEARQTILEGQYPLRNGIQKIPDVKRGDMVQVKLISGGIQLSTGAQVQEPGYREAPVRILTSKTKKELQGTVKEGGVVEVRL